MDKELQKENVERFFRSEYGKLLNFVRKNLDERFFGASPVDIIQDVALGLISRLDLDTQVGNLTAYIYRSVRNRIIDSRNKKQRNVSIENFTDHENGNYALNTMADETLTEEQEYINIEPALLREAIAALRPDEQALIIATEFDQRSYDELSGEWEVPIGTLLSRKHRGLWIVLGILGFTALLFLFGAIIMWLWNVLMPVVFHLGIITYWQAVGLAILARLLFGSLHHGSHHGRRRGFGSWLHGRHMQPGCNDESGSMRWSYYEQYWKEEGEQAFNEYIRRKTDKPAGV